MTQSELDEAVLVMNLAGTPVPEDSIQAISDNPVDLTAVFAELRKDKGDRWFGENRTVVLRRLKRLFPKLEKEIDEEWTFLGGRGVEYDPQTLQLPDVSFWQDRIDKTDKAHRAALEEKDEAAAKRDEVITYFAQREAKRIIRQLEKLPDGLAQAVLSELLKDSAEVSGVPEQTSIMGEGNGQLASLMDFATREAAAEEMD